MNNFFSTIEELLVVLIVVLGFLLGFWVWKDNPQKKLNQWFVLLTTSVVVWVFFAFLGFFIDNVFYSLIFYRINAAAVALFVLSSFYFYVVHFLGYKKNKIFKIIKKTILLTGSGLIILSLFTSTIIKNVVLKNWGTEIIFGPVNIFLNLYALFVGCLVLVFLIKRYVHSFRSEKLKIQYFLLGTILFALFNIIFNIFSPIITDTVIYQHFGDYSAIFLLGFTAYAIVKRNLFGIKVILTEILVSIIAILLFINIFVSGTRFEYIWNTGLFLIFVFFSFFLLRSVWRRMRAREKVRKYANRLRRANRRLRKLDEQKTEFISFAAHQLRSPLTSVKGFASLILEGSLGKMPSKVKEAVQNIYDSADSMIDSVEDYLNITRIEQGRMDYDVDEFDLYEVAEAVVDEHQPHAYKKKLDLIITSDSDKNCYIKADQGKTKQVISNLVDNAIKYTLEGSIKVHLAQREVDNKKVVRLSVTDTGRGMSPQDIKKLFKKYSRADNTENIKGSGLGLFIAKKMVEGQKGKIWAESEGEGEGSTFIVEFPAAE